MEKLENFKDFVELIEKNNQNENKNLEENMNKKFKEIIKNKTMIDSASIGHRIYTLRKKSRLSQNDLASLIHTSQNAIALIEKGAIKKINKLAMLARVFNVPLNYLVYGDKTSLDAETKLFLEKQEEINPKKIIVFEFEEVLKIFSSKDGLSMLSLEDKALIADSGFFICKVKSYNFR